MFLYGESFVFFFMIENGQRNVNKRNELILRTSGTLSKEGGK